MNLAPQAYMCVIYLAKHPLGSQHIYSYCVTVIYVNHKHQQNTTSTIWLPLVI